jgi:hypothetical protein
MKCKIAMPGEVYAAFFSIFLSPFTGMVRYGISV